jgi:hypothetical protein
VAGILLTMADARTRLAAEVEAELRRHFGSLVFTATIPRSVRLGRSPEPRCPRDCLRPPLGRRRGVLEGGDGACRAFLRSGVVSGAAWRSCWGRRVSRSSCTSRRDDPPQPAPAPTAVRAGGRGGSCKLDPTAGRASTRRRTPPRRGRVRAHRR